MFLFTVWYIHNIFTHFQFLKKCYKEWHSACKPSQQSMINPIKAFVYIIEVQEYSYEMDLH